MMKWQRIEGLPNKGNLFVLAKTNDGRIMVFRASMLFDIIKRTAADGQPEHLQFPATHYILCGDLLKLPEM